MSGFYYYLVPHGINWNAAQVMLIAHIALGVLAFVALAPFVVAHQRHQDGSSLLLLAPWLRRWRRGAGAAEAHPQRLVGHALHWSLLLVVASGVFVAVPGLLFYAGAVWLLTYESYQVGNAVHLGLTVVALGLMLLHWRLLRRLRARNDRR
ncbi:MAG: hypothetical protein IT201_03870 [Thermoleophilia bacterium]|nr:hypothetical protein [Thermoleophilia bacterium]